MSTYRQIIALADSYRPNALEEELKFWWLVTLDGKIAAEVMLVDVTDVRAILDFEYPDGLDNEPFLTRNFICTIWKQRSPMPMKNTTPIKMRWKALTQLINRILPGC